MHCVLGAGEVSRGGWEGPGKERPLGLLLGKALTPSVSRSSWGAGGRGGQRFSLQLSWWEWKVPRLPLGSLDLLLTFPKTLPRVQLSVLPLTHSVTLGKSCQVSEP